MGNQTLTEKTPIPIGLAFSIGGVVVALVAGGAAWATNIFFQIQSLDESVVSMEKKQDSYWESMSSVQKDVAVIKSKIDDLHKLMERKRR